jgi:hypothetical protein
VQWLPAGEAIRVVPQGAQRARTDETKRLSLFDQAAARQRERESARPLDHRSEGSPGGPARSFMSATALVDTKRPGLPLRPRFPRKQTIANELLRDGIADGSLHLPHQAVVEFVAAVTRRS